MKENPQQGQYEHAFESQLKIHYNEKKLKAINQSIDAVVKQISNLTGKNQEDVGKNIKRIEIKGGQSKNEQINDVLVISREKPNHHGPLSPIIPHECHISVKLCNPLPFGPQVCVEVELPWPCPDIVFEPGPFE
ncbi:hypothetical protein KJS94_12525 [Flavihumibacter rivuli]|uniref:hypothetical protein n=1 Tax=Flavihumibacter rivuli TaxID=2838156 RepID=UPI001BDF617E|nr:hypothetical protein [Flavihumibacter rivuli]ULQ55468.1 hypothetical protein KJS94_12525 [Flavihumibacter rivuli]